MPGMAVSAMARSAWLQGAGPREPKAGMTSCSQTQGAWRTLGRESRCAVVSPSMGDSSGFSSEAQSWEQVWEGDQDTVEAVVGPAGPRSPGRCKPETLLPASHHPPFPCLSAPSPFPQNSDGDGCTSEGRCGD